jgi:homoserine O-acetyltransferase/O-succinyltransferase
VSFITYISPETKFFHHAEPFGLEQGGELPELTVAYRQFGTLSRNGDNAILICHALTGSADADDWWKPLFGAGCAFDTEKEFVICSNILGSCYGSTGSVSINPKTNRHYGASFPMITIRDMVRVQKLLIDALGIQKIKMAIGGSLGGMQVLEWAAMFPERVQTIAPLCVSGKHSAWCIGIGEAERLSIYADAEFKEGNYDLEQQPRRGLAAARALAMLTYRTPEVFEKRFARKVQSAEQIEKQFEIESYLRYQGDKLVNRFDANTYITLTKAMDTHDLSRGRGEYADVLASINCPALVVSADSDGLYLPSEQAELARLLPKASLEIMHTPNGHDAFLIDTADLNAKIVAFKKRNGLVS